MDLSTTLSQAIAVATSYGWHPYFAAFLGVCVLLFARHIFRSDSRPQPVEFDIFARTSYPQVEEPTTLTLSQFSEEFARKHENESLVIKDGRAYSASFDFIAAVKEYVESSKRPALVISPSNMPVDINLGQMKQSGDSVITDGPHKGFSIRYPHLSLITIKALESRIYTTIIIRGARITRVVVEGAFLGSLYFEDCWIASLEIEAHASALPVLRVSLSRCYICDLNIKPNGCTTFSMTKGGIRGLNCPTTSQPSPVTNLFEIDEAVALHQEPKHVAPEQIGGYRDLLFHIRSRSSPLTQQLVNAAVLRLERKGDPGFLRSANFCYWVFSAYNTRPERPLVWMLFSVIICSYVAFALDLTTITRGCGGQEISWVTTLCDQSVQGKAIRSLVLAVNSLMNPFGVFSDTALIKSRTVSFNFVLIMIGLLNLVWVTLTIFSIKTRFSVKASGS